MKNIVLLFILVVCSASFAYSQRNFAITNNSAGGVKLGMTVAQARRALRICRFKRTSDGEGVALIAITCPNRRNIIVFADEDYVDAPIAWQHRIEFIEVFDRRFKTEDGVHPGMPLRTAERILGKVKEIIITQIESREFVTFRKVRKGIEYRTYGGIYTRPSVTTTKYEPGSGIFSIQVSKR